MSELGNREIIAQVNICTIQYLHKSIFAQVNICTSQYLHKSIFAQVNICTSQLIMSIVCYLYSGDGSSKNIKKVKICKFVTVILFGTMSESFRKIARIVFELRSLCGDGDGDGRDVVPKQAFSF